jgi:hypothetical protein
MHAAYGYPVEVLNFLRDIVSGDVKGEIREVSLINSVRKAKGHYKKPIRERKG